MKLALRIHLRMAFAWWKAQTGKTHKGKARGAFCGKWQLRTLVTPPPNAQATARFASLSLGGEEAPMLAAPLEEVGGFVLSAERRNDERKRWHVERV